MTKQLSAVCFLTEKTPFLSLKEIQNSADSQLGDSKAHLISSLSILEICLLVAIQKCLHKNFEQLNFEMVYDEYRAFTQRMSTYGRGVNLFFVKSIAQKVSIYVYYI